MGKKINTTYSKYFRLMTKQYKSIALFDSKSSEAFLCSISEREQKPEALVIRNNAPLDCWPIFFTYGHSYFRNNTQNATKRKRKHRNQKTYSNHNSHAMQMPLHFGHNPVYLFYHFSILRQLWKNLRLKAYHFLDFRM